MMWIISGGLVAAVTGPLGLEHGSWSAAYQVLVGGVVQAGLGAAQYALVSVRPRAATLVALVLLIRTVRAEALDPGGRCGPTEACSRSP